MRAPGTGQVRHYSDALRHEADGLQTGRDDCLPATQPGIALLIQNANSLVMP